MPSSSTSSSDFDSASKAAWLPGNVVAWAIKLMTIVVVLAWAGYFVSSAFESAIDIRFGDAVQKAIRFRTYEPARFVSERLCEVAWLTTVLCFLIASFLFAYVWIRDRFGRIVRLGVLSLLGLVCVNLFVLAGSHTAVYWLVLLTLARDYKYTSVAAEERMLVDSRASQTGFLMGSSQAPAQVDVRDLNKDLGPSVQFANVAYAGSEPIDLYMQYRRSPVTPDIVVCYVSEIAFCRGINDAHVLTLWSGAAKSKFAELGVSKYISTVAKRYGSLARVVPLFRSRRGVERVLMGASGPPPVRRCSLTMEEWRERQLKQDRAFMDEFKMGEHFEIQCQVFDAYLQQLASDNVRVFVISGTMSDVMALRCSPSLNYREQMNKFLAKMDDKYANLTVACEGQELPQPTIDKYKDYLHMADDCRPWFTRELTEYLADELEIEIQPAGSAAKSIRLDPTD